MKNAIFICFLLFSISIKAQKRFVAGVKAGLSTSQVAGDTYGGFHKAGGAGGIFVTGMLNEKWTAQLEMIFIQKGSKYTGNPDIGDYSYYNLRLNYLEVPLLFQFHQKKFTFELGPSFGYLISSQEDYYLNNGPAFNPYSFKNTEIGAGAGIEYRLIKNLFINWRYSNSILAIRKYTPATRTRYIPGQRNNVLAFTLTYRFAGKDAE
jgi:hypothetical protein